MITVSDMMSHLSVQLSAVLAGALEAKVRTAVLNAWGRLMSMHDWGYFHRQGALLLRAGQTSGMIDFDVGTSEVTLTGSTWPADATTRHLQIDGQWFPVKTRVSNTVLELYPDNAPSEDKDDESYVLQQIIYPLPYEVGDIVQLVDGGASIPLRLSILETFNLAAGVRYSTGLPTRYALIADTKNPQRWNLWVPTQQTIDVPMQYLYVARRPPNAISRVTEGTVDVTAGVASFSDSVIQTDWAGVLLRVSKDTNHPTNEFGDTPGNDVVLNQNCYELLVTGFTSATECLVNDTAFSATEARYNASSLIDVADGPMQVLLQRLCEDEYGAKVVGNHNEMMVSKSRLSDAFNEARASDARRVRHQTLPGAWYNLLSRAR